MTGQERKEHSMLRLMLAALVLTAFPHLAGATETIGTIRATVDGVESEWQTIRHSNSDGTDASARVYDLGPMSTVEIQGIGEDTLVMEVAVVGGLAPGAMGEVQISLFPKGEGFMGTRWTSEDAGIAPALTFETLALDGTGGNASGTFAARLCRAEGFEEIDTSDCREISGRFETELLVVEE